MARIAGLALLVACAYVALRNGSHPKTRDIGHGVDAGCGRVFASQLPQLALGVGCAALLLVSAARDAVTGRALLVAGALLAMWALAATLLPSAFAWDCVN